MNRISVVIPSYNQAQYLEDCLESAYNQTVSPHEIIVVDDGSTDNSLEIADRYRFAQFPGIESPVRVVSQVNKGLPSARNTGIMNATGDWVLLLDADDMLKEDAIEKLTRAISDFPTCDVIAPSFETFGLSEQKVILGAFTFEDMKVGNRLGYFSLIRKSVLLEIGGYSPRMKFGFEDYHLWFNLFARGKNFAVLQDVLVRYRTKEKSMIHDAMEHQEYLMEQIKKDFPQLWK